MTNAKSILLPEEKIRYKIQGSFEIENSLGIHFKFGEFIITDRRLVWYTNPPLGPTETEIYDFNKVTDVNINNCSFSLENNLTIKSKWISYGNSVDFYEELNRLMR